ncbi:hypothetical protein ACH5RR_036102 [Cinchona calisaya]|uniref:Uncharacterized protein n=1 Tax=Cinchona calisaya TaxID=153742 RepID=A0ABD2Y3F5_9GENT
MLVSSHSAWPKQKPKPDITPSEPIIELKGLVKPNPDGENEQSGRDSENDGVGLEKKGNLLRNKIATVRLRAKSEAPGSDIPGDYRSDKGEKRKA